MGMGSFEALDGVEGWFGEVVDGGKRGVPVREFDGVLGCCGLHTGVVGTICRR